MTRIVLIRHGQTAWNKEERIRGQVEVPLDQTGLAQAELTAERVVREWRPAAVYCSPLQRALQTAEAVARRLSVPLQPTAGFNDMHFGEWQGLAPAEVLRRWPGMAQTWLQAPDTITFPGGESLDGLRERSMTALRELIARHPKDDVVVVAHTVVNRVVLMAVLGLDNSHYWRIGQDTCAINVFRWEREQFYLDSLNDTCHLEVATRRMPVV